jgi:hypothetical protein
MLLSVFWPIAFIFYGELYPTTVNCIGFSIIGFAGAVGSICSSYLISFLIREEIVPFLILGGLGIFASVHVLFMKETFN